MAAFLLCRDSPRIPLNLVIEALCLHSESAADLRQGNWMDT
jgi:hypothetical protein